MEGARVWLRRIQSLFRRRRLEGELNEDVRNHLEMAVEEGMRQGLTRKDAEVEARRQFGGIEQMKEEFRDQSGVPLLDGLGREFRLALRSLLRRPGFALIAVLTLALGIGANTAVFSLIDAVLISPLPYPEADRLATVWQDLSVVGLDRVEATSADFLDWRADSETFEDMAGFFSSSFNLTGDGTPERYDGYEVTPNLFRLLGVEPVLGRSFLDSEGEPGGIGDNSQNEALAPYNVVILSHGLWQERFGSDPGILGQALTLNGRLYEVVGVMPSGFQFPDESVRLWTPFAPNPNNRVTLFLQVVGRLRAGASFDEARGEMNTIATRLEETYPGTNRDRSSVVILPLHDQFVEDQRTSLWLLLAASGLVLLVSCANVAGLLITRSIGRSREVEIRAALGAGRVQLARQLLVEGLTLSLAGGALGAFVAVAAFRYLETLVPVALRGAVAPELNLRLGGFALIVSLLSGLAFGLAPLHRMFHLAGNRGLRTREIGSLRDRSRPVLVSAEIALAVVVIASAGLMIRTLQNLESVDPGFRAENVLTARLESFRAGETFENRRRFYDEVVERIERLPGVSSAGFTTFLPYTSVYGANYFVLEDRPDLPQDVSVAYRREITPGLRSAIGLPLLAGRDFDARDSAGSPPVVLVSEFMANLLEGNAVGRRVGLPQADGSVSWLTIVGVVGDIRMEGLDRPSERAVMYLPVAQSEQLWFFSPRDLVVRTSGDPASLAGALRDEVWAVDPDQSVSSVQTLETVVHDQIGEERTLAFLFSTLSMLVLFLAALGVYGLMSFVVTARAREFGLRMALGAERRDLALVVLRQGVVWIGAGLAVGLSMALAVTQSLESLLFGVEPVDPVSMIMAIVALCAAAFLATLVPVWRATRSDPMVVLRFD